MTYNQANDIIGFTEIMFDEIKSKFLDYLHTQSKANATIVAYGKDIEQLITTLRALGKASFEEVGREDLQKFLDQLKKEGFTPKTISRKINSIKTFYRFLKAENLVKQNPAAELTHPKYDLREPRVLNKMEYRALRDCCRTDIRTYAIIELFLQTGLRISELAGLQLSDIGDSLLKITEREIPLNEAAAKALTKYLAIRPESDNHHVFITKSGKQLLIRNIRSSIDRILRVAGIENAKVNDLRATFIAHQLASGAHLEYISKLVGHKRISTTERYLKLVKAAPTKGEKLTEL